MVRPLAVGAGALCIAALLACNAPAEVWQTVTRNARYRDALDAGILDVDSHIEKLEEQLRSPPTSPTHLAVGLMAHLKPPRHLDPRQIKRELSALRDHRRELKRERAELSGDVPPTRRRCPVHGNWMFREVVATEPTDAPGMTPVEGRLELWKYPYRGRAAPYSTTQLLPYSRPWICSACQEAHVHWQPRVTQHLSSNAWPLDHDHILIEVITAVEAWRPKCRRILEWSSIETPFDLTATFTALPDGTLSEPELDGSEQALQTDLARCLTQVIGRARLRKHPSEPIEIERLPMWLEL
jgi:hypothetical protein